MKLFFDRATSILASTTRFELKRAMLHDLRTPDHLFDIKSLYCVGYQYN